MNAKPNFAPVKKNLHAKRAHYTWHLRPPFNDEFDHSHWWEGQSEIRPVAALYELARRHPRVGNLRFKLRHASWYGKELLPPLTGKALKIIAEKSSNDLGQEPDAIHTLCLIGLKRWSNLTSGEQELWWETAGNMKGLDTRDEVVKCESITFEALAEVSVWRAFCALADKAKKTKGMTNDKFMSLTSKFCKEHPYSTEEFEKAISSHAVNAHRQGHLLIAIAPDLKADEAISLLYKKYRTYQKLHPLPKQRARDENWLPLIAAFDNEEDNPPGKKTQTFVKYRRAVDGIRFPPRL